MKPADFRHLEPMRVRWAEIDMQKIVFNGHYLMYLDTAVAGYWRSLALPYEATMHALGGDLYVRKATLEYLGSARYDDRLEVGIRCERIGNSSMALQGAVFREGRLLVGGELVYVFADPATQTSKPVPGPLREVLQAFEAGQPMVEVTTGTWGALGPAAGPLRRSVFTEEQGIAAELDDDGADATAVHALAVNRLGRPVGTARLLAHGPGTARIGRMAVSRTVRGAGVGRALLDALAAAARARGDRTLLLHAQASAVGFYRRLGFEPQGDAFEEAGIEHQTMVRAA